MPRNRISRWLPSNPPGSPIASSGFVACPLVLQLGVGEEMWAVRRQLYQWAMDQAAAVVRPSIVERWQANLVN